MRAAKSFATLPRDNNNAGGRRSVEKEELLSKLELIEEQARLTLDEFPRDLAKERQRMIISLAKHIRWLLSDNGLTDAESTIRMPVDRRLS
jgi:hypothetical protein